MIWAIGITFLYRNTIMLHNLIKYIAINYSTKQILKILKTETHKHFISQQAYLKHHN